MPEFDLAIRGGMMIDGTRAPRFQTDIGVKNGRIAKIGRIRPDAAVKVVDAGGLIVAPGFIDLHTHYDAQVFWDPYLTLSGWHGVTSVVIGNCGFGFPPVHRKDVERAMLTMQRVEAIPLASMQAAMPFDWESYPQYMDSIDRAPKGVNILPYVPMTPLINYVMGIEGAKSGKPPTDAQHAEMRRLLNEAMDAGAHGWSAQRLKNAPSNLQLDYDGTPMATDMMPDETFIEMARVLGERGEGYQELSLGSMDPKADAAYFELLAKVSGRPIMYQGLSAKERYPHRHRNTIKWLERCRAQGLPVYAQAFSTNNGQAFTFEDWAFFDDAAPWRDATLGAIAEKKAKLGDPARRPALREELPRLIIKSSFSDIIISEVARPENKHLEGMTLGDAGEKLGKHFVDGMLDLAVSEDLKTEFYLSGYGSDLVKEIVDYPYVCFGVSDGGAHVKFHTPGIYPTDSIVRFCREKQWISLEDVHWRLSGLPAFYAGFRDRGFLREGAPADILVYDYENLKALPMVKAYDLPGGEWRRVQRAEGYKWIIVNGEVTFKDDLCTGATPGRLMRHGVTA